MTRTPLHALLGCLVVLAAGCDATSSAPGKKEVPEELRLPPPYRGPVRALLTPGEDLPELRCKGWLNGEPKPIAKGGPKVHVIDVWAPWSPHCKAFGPKLAALHDKYHPRGVQFVSVTDMPKQWATTYGKENAIGWPSGYSLPHDVLGELGATNSGTMLLNPGYSIAPTIYVVGPDGKVRGGDDQGRLRRTESPDVVKQLDALIEKTLAEAGDAPKKP